MMKLRVLITSFLLLTFVWGCATMPTGPSVMALPGDGKGFDQFRLDDMICRQYASEQIGGMQDPQNAGASSALVGAALGAATGAAIGSFSANVGAGAAIGAASGLLLGTLAGPDYSYRSYYEAQRRYDHAYIQCMYSKGNQVPVSRGSISGERQAPSRWTPPPARNYQSPPPPPPGPGTLPPPDYR